MIDENYDLYNLPEDKDYAVDILLKRLDGNVERDRIKSLKLSEISLLYKIRGY